MPTFYNYRENGGIYSFDDVFVPANAFRQGRLWGGGWNLSAELGDNTTTNRSIPVTTFAGGANWKQVSGGVSHTAAIKTDGTLWVWGYNIVGDLGTNDTNTRSTPVQIFGSGTNWKQVAAGSAAIKTDGTLWTWGGNTEGKLGTNTTGNSLTPVTTFAGGTNWKQVDTKYHTAAIKTDGTLWTWGWNSNGQLGILSARNTNNRTTPVTTFLGGSTWKQVACGEEYTAAIKTDGTLWTWGLNSEGQLGNNSTNTRCTPVTTFLGGTTWKQVACGEGHTAAIKTDGTLWIWGRNSYGQLGINSAGTTEGRTTPVTTFLGGSTWKQVACGFNHTAAIKTDGTLWTWGRNLYGQLRNNTTETRCTPIITAGGATNWKQVSCGDDSTLTITYIDDYQ